MGVADPREVQDQQPIRSRQINIMPIRVEGFPHYLGPFPCITSGYSFHASIQKTSLHSIHPAMAVQNIVSQIRGALTKSTPPASYGTVERAPLPRKHSGSSSDTSSTLSVDSDVEHIEDDAASSKSSRKPFISPRLISDATIGLSDGLTVPFALTAGLSALGDTRLVIYGGMAELFAGAISMGVGGCLGARSEW